MTAQQIIIVISRIRIRQHPNDGYLDATVQDGMKAS